MADDDRIPTRVQAFLLEQIDGQALLYHPGHTKSIWLNETATMVWGLCDGQRTISQIAACFSEAFADDGPVVLEDVQAILRRFADEGAVDLR